MRYPRVLASLLLVVLCAALARDAEAFRPAPLAPGKPGYATINLDRVFKETNMRADWDARLKSMEEKLGADAKLKQEAVNSKKNKMEPLPPGDEKTALREALAMDILEAEAWFKFSTAELDRERALMWQDLYESMKTESAALAKAQGFDLILVNDSLPEIKTTGDAKVSLEAIVLQQITSRRVVYGAKEIDVTDQLVTRMNNAFAAGPTGAPAATKPAATPAAPPSATKPGAKPK